MINNLWENSSDNLLEIVSATNVLNSYRDEVSNILETSLNKKLSVIKQLSKSLWWRYSWYINICWLNGVWWYSWRNRTFIILNHEKIYFLHNQFFSSKFFNLLLFYKFDFVNNKCIILKIINNN